MNTTPLAEETFPTWSRLLRWCEHHQPGPLAHAFLPGGETEEARITDMFAIQNEDDHLW